MELPGNLRQPKAPTIKPSNDRGSSAPTHHAAVSSTPASRSCPRRRGLALPLAISDHDTRSQVSAWPYCYIHKPWTQTPAHAREGLALPSGQMLRNGLGLEAKRFCPLYLLYPTLVHTRGGAGASFIPWLKTHRLGSGSMCHGVLPGPVCWPRAHTGYSPCPSGD